MPLERGHDITAEIAQYFLSGDRAQQLGTDHRIIPLPAGCCHSLGFLDRQQGRRIGNAHILQHVQIVVVKEVTASYRGDAQHPESVVVSDQPGRKNRRSEQQAGCAGRDPASEARPLAGRNHNGRDCQDWPQKDRDRLGEHAQAPQKITPHQRLKPPGTQELSELDEAPCEQGQEEALRHVEHRVRERLRKASENQHPESRYRVTPGQTPSQFVDARGCNSEEDAIHHGCYSRGDKWVLYDYHRTRNHEWKQRQIVRGRRRVGARLR